MFFIAYVVGWFTLTGSLMTFSCHSPLNNTKEECRAEVEANREYQDRAWHPK